ncbi:hypothetical protein HMPREF0262_02857 [Clostridium sp. ATCC 29733]|nr:hypothetical protein HMPREF0262_02857 [Clostridium sp. ATCC 29733]
MGTTQGDCRSFSPARAASQRAARGRGKALFAPPYKWRKKGGNQSLQAPGLRPSFSVF